MATVRIPLNSRKYPGLFALIDESDYDLVRGRKWSPSKRPHRFYAYTIDPITKKPVAMHRILMDAPSNMEVDHINGDGLDNRRANLRIATHRQNMANQRMRSGTKSRYKGVTLHTHKKVPHWAVEISFNGRRKFLGYFDNEEDAARAYDRKAVQVFGEFANTNFPIQVAILPPEEDTGPKWVRGERQKFAKLTDDKVREMRAIHMRGGLTQRQIAKMFGVSYGTTSQILNRKRWTHVE